MDEFIRAQNEARRVEREAKYPCPQCLKPGLAPMGGGNTCWFECSCGAYSPLATSWAAARENIEGWSVVDPNLNACMYPPVGG
jgi:hypothetical protein